MKDIKQSLLIPSKNEASRYCLGLLHMQKKSLKRQPVVLEGGCLYGGGCFFCLFFFQYSLLAERGKHIQNAVRLSVPRNKSQATSELKSAGHKSTVGFGKKS